MFNIVKKNRVLYDKEPEIITVRKVDSSGTQSMSDVGRILKKNAAESADLSLKKAIGDAGEIKRDGNVRAKIAFLEAAEEGRRRGFEDGRKKGRIDGAASADKNVKAAAENFVSDAFRLDMEYLKRLGAAKADCVDFAFGLAENILGIKIDRDSEDYQKLIDRFFCRKPCKAAIEVDGNKYSFETLQAEGLVSCSDGLQGVLVSAETQNDDEQETAETEPEDTAEKETKTELTNQPEQPTYNAQPQIAESTDDDSSGVKIEASEPYENENSESAQQSGGETEDDTQDETDSEKYVFVKPAHKTASVITDGTVIKKADIDLLADLEPEELKAVLHRAKIDDIAAALDKASDETKEEILNALPRRSREKVLEVKKYLGPVPKEEIDAAAARLLSFEDTNTREGDEGDVQH